MSDMRSVIAELLKCRPADLANNSSLGNTPGWDSFAQLSIMMELEQRYGIPITEKTIRAYSNLAAIHRLEEGEGDP